MTFVDDRGRLFGRWNLFDAMLVLVGVGLIPLVYGAYMLFRTPLPVLTAVEPARLQQGNNLRVSIRGKDLRPYLRVSFGSRQGVSFLFKDVTTAEVELGDIGPGVYDVVLYDQAQERSRLPKALTIDPVPLPNTEVIVVGSFANLTKETAQQIKVGTKVTGVGEVAAVGRPLPESTRVYAGTFVVDIPVETAVRLPAAIRAHCQVRASAGYPQCVVGDVALQPTTFLLLLTPLGTLPFQVDQVRGLQPVEPVRVRVRLSGPAAAIAAVKPDDMDHGTFVNELAAGATVLAAGPVQRVSEAQAVREVDLRVAAQRNSNSWTYANGPLKIGGPFVLRTFLYELTGTVVALTPGSGEAAAKP